MAERDAWAVLATGNAIERLEAARELGRNPDPTTIDRLIRAKGEQSDSWVIRALESAIELARRSGANPQTAPIWISSTTDADIDDLLSTATQRASAILIHETRPLVGDIRQSAQAELGNAFQGSITERAVDRISEFLNTMGKLHEAAKAPTFVEFDLTEFARTAIAENQLDERTGARGDPAIVQGDPALLRLAFDNVIRNAVEASNGQGKNVVPGLVVNWAAADQHAWVVVLDEGTGLPAGMGNAFEAGTTTKPQDAHFGMGLAIASQAVKSMGGSLILTPREVRGTACEIRWSQELQAPL